MKRLTLAGVWLTAALLGLLQPIAAAPAKAPILLYHHIAPGNDVYHVSPQEFEQQLYFLATHDYYTLSLENYLDDLRRHVALPAHPVILTIDDGYRDAYETAFPLLKKYNMTATFFIVTGQVGYPAYMTWDQIEEMQRAGMEIGAHTVHHPYLTRLSTINALYELVLSRIVLETHLKTPISVLAYPYGDHDSRIAWLAYLAGFKAACIVAPYASDRVGNPYALPRIIISPGDTLSRFEALVNGPESARQTTLTPH